jgi:type II secretory pathway component HofQ
VQVIEGNSAHVAHGISAPLLTAVAVARRGSGIAVEYREIASGFTVTPRINGERAVIDIVSEQQRAIGSTRASTHRVATTVAARLGEWTELGGVTESGGALDGEASLTGGTRRTTTQSDRRVIEVKVDVLE